VADKSAKLRAESGQKAVCSTIVRNLSLSGLEYLLYGVQRTLRANWAAVGFDASVVFWLTKHFQDFSVNFLA